MALKTPSKAPTWEEIRTGMTAAAAESNRIRGEMLESDKMLKAIKAEREVFHAAMKEANANYYQWEAALRRLTFRE